MSYNKKTWVSGETITKEALNNIENGIAILYENQNNSTNTNGNQNNYVNVKMFRCDDGEYVKGDGIHDDTTGMQRAHDTGQVVYYPKGEYHFNKISIVSGGILGESMNDTVLRTYSTNDDNIITYTGAYGGNGTHYAGATFKSFSLWGEPNGIQPTKTGGAGIFMLPADQHGMADFTNISFRYLPTGLKSNNALCFTITNCHFYFYRDFGIDYRNDGAPDAGDIGIVDCTFFNGDSINNGWGIYQRNAGGTRVSSSKFNGGAGAIWLDVDRVTSDLLINNNSFENAETYALLFENNTNTGGADPNQGYTAFANIVICGNQFAINANDILFKPVANYLNSSYWDSVSITGNTFRQFHSGVSVEISTSRSFVVSSNTFFGPSRGIVIHDTCTNGEIGLNSFFLTGTPITNEGTNVNVMSSTKVEEDNEGSKNELEGEWTDITLLNGFTSYGLVPVQYRVVDAHIEFKGTIVCPSSAIGKETVVFELPDTIKEQLIPYISYKCENPWQSSVLRYSNPENDYPRGVFYWLAENKGNTTNLEIITLYMQARLN